MKAPPSSFRHLAGLVLVLAAATFGGCVSHQHTVGLGPTGTGEVVARQYYLLFGLVQVNDVDAQRMAGDLTSYQVDTRFGLVDLVLSPFLLAVTGTSRTVTVRT